MKTSIKIDSQKKAYPRVQTDESVYQAIRNGMAISTITAIKYHPSAAIARSTG